MGTIKISGKSFSGDFSGKNIVVSDSCIFIDGKAVDTGGDLVISIVVDGNIDTLDVAYAKSIEIKGDVNDVTTTAGNVNVTGHVEGWVKTNSGDVMIGTSVKGDVSTNSGKVTAQAILGKVKTNSGDIMTRP